MRRTSRRRSSRGPTAGEDVPSVKGGERRPFATRVGVDAAGASSGLRRHADSEPTRPRGSERDGTTARAVPSPIAAARVADRPPHVAGASTRTVEAGLPTSGVRSDRPSRPSGQWHTWIRAWIAENTSTGGGRRTLEGVDRTGVDRSLREGGLERFEAPCRGLEARCRTCSRGADPPVTAARPRRSLTAFPRREARDGRDTIPADLEREQHTPPRGRRVR